MVLLLKSGARPSAADAAGTTPLHSAARQGHRHCADLLLSGSHGKKKHAADVNAVTAEGRTPLHEACCHGHAHVVELLLQKGAWTGVQDRSGTTPLKMANDRGHAVVVAALRRGPGVTKKAGWGLCTRPSVKT